MDTAAIRSKLGDMLGRVGRAVWDESPPLGSPRGAYSRWRFSDWLTYRQWDDLRQLYQTEKSVGFILETTPLLGADSATSRILAEIFNEAMPPGAYCQVISWASPKVGGVLDPWARARAGGGEIYAQIAEHRRAHLKKAVWEGASRKAPFHLRDFRCFFSVELAGNLSQVGVVDTLIEAREKIVSSLLTIHTPSEVVDPPRLIAFLSDLLNPTTSIRPAAPAYDPHRYICEQVVRHDTTFTRYRDCIKIQAWCDSDQLDGPDHERSAEGRNEVFEMRGFSVRQYPAEWTQGHMSRTLGDMFNDQLRLVGSTLTCLSYQTLGAEKTKSETEFKRMRSDQAMQNPMAKMFPNSRKKAEEWTHVAEDVAEGALLAKVALFMVSITPTGLAERAERALRSVYRASGFTLQRDDDIHIQTLLACLPIGLGCGLMDDLKTFGRLAKMPTTAVTRLACMQGEFLGAEQPHILLAGRRGQPFFWSPFSNSDGNHNVCVVGSSGSGKSVLMQDIAAGLVGAGVWVVAIDDGFSFRNSCLMQGGAFIRFNLDLDVCINPFSMADHAAAARDAEYAAECKTNIKYQVEQMARGALRASAEEAGVIERAVSQVWEKHGPKGSIDLVVEALKDEVFGQRGQDLALSMAPYTSDGIYGAFFNGPANLEITNRFTVIEMSDLETKKDLRAVIMLSMLFLVRQRMRDGGRGQRKALIIDEAWQLLSDGATGDFIEGFARRCRKEGGCIITGTQSVNDYYKTSGARACLENSDWQIFLRLKTEALEQLRNDSRLSVDEIGMQFLKSLKTSDGEYSELMVQGPHGRFVGRLVLDPFSATLYSTKPEIYARIQHYQSLGLSLAEAVRCVAFGEEPKPLSITHQPAKAA